MKMKSLLGIMLSLSILQSCQNDETNGIQNEVNKNGITFMSLIDDTNNSRAYDTSWETNDVIGVFMLASENKKYTGNKRTLCDIKRRRLFYQSKPAHVLS